MPFVHDLPAKLKALTASAAEFAGARGKALWEKRGVFAACLGAALVLLILGLAIPAVMNNNAGGKDVPEAARPAIPPGELFLPEEPDFVPQVLLEREPRESWSAEDAAPFWHDPLKMGEEPWRRRIEEAIDELLEEVP
jgi:hypothetical protein